MKKVFLAGIVLLLIVAIISGCQSQNRVSTAVVTETVCDDQPVAFKGCDMKEGCRCTNKQFFGLGNCDTCLCKKCWEETREVPAR